jgi:hypothetical protein
MKRTLNIILFIFFTFLAFTIWAQKEKNDDRAKAPKYVPVYTYLGNSNLKGGTIKKSVLDSLLKQGIHAKDESGHIYQVDGFNFTYGERNLYEDSIGNLKIMTDYLLEKCFGDSLSGYIINSMADRSKEGDTVYFDKIMITRPDNTTTLSKAMKFTIVQ